MAISDKARSLRAAGRKVIGFGLGEPDFPTPAHVVEAAREAAADPANHHYTPAAGLPELRDAVAAVTSAQTGISLTSSNVVVSNGAKQAVYVACAALLDPGDEVILPAPYWVSYVEMIRLAGGDPVPVFAGSEQGLRVTVDQLEGARTDRTKMLLFTSPSNPSGVVYGAAETEAIGRWAAAHDIWVVTDQIYENLVYSPAVFSALPALVPEIAARCVVISGVAKTYAMTGWRVGWLVAPPEVAAAATRMQSHMSSNVSNVSQRAAMAAITGPQDVVAEMREIFDRRRRIMVDMLRRVPGIDLVEPQGAFYTFPKLTALLGAPLRGRKARSTVELADLILDEVDVAYVPGEAFGAPGYSRFSFAVAEEELVEGLTRIAGLVGGE